MLPVVAVAPCSVCPKVGEPEAVLECGPTERRGRSSDDPEDHYEHYDDQQHDQQQVKHGCFRLLSRFWACSWSTAGLCVRSPGLRARALDDPSRVFWPSRISG